MLQCLLPAVKEARNGDSGRGAEPHQMQQHRTQQEGEAEQSTQNHRGPHYHCGIFTSDASSYLGAWPAVQEGARHERREQTVRIE
jgi:hypothetical protein